jgi:ABC-type lipoprotein export system ATPase subunit
MEHLRRLAREKGSAVITVTHDERMIDGFDRVRRVRDGRLLLGPEETGVSQPLDLPVAGRSIVTPLPEEEASR